MNDFSTAFSTALTLLMSGDEDLMEIVGLSLRVSLFAVAIATIIGMPLGAATALYK
ncbi:MAG: ABC transporter permease, partial [Rhodospirillaceae bacterium]|nr:ABC transporter permease [Rhodospirillaceae bacterium]